MRDIEEWEIEERKPSLIPPGPLNTPHLASSQVPWPLSSSTPSPTLLIFALSHCSHPHWSPASGLAPFQPPSQSFLKCTLDYAGSSPTPLNGAQDLPPHGPADLSSVFSLLHSSQTNNSQVPIPAQPFPPGAFAHTFLSITQL